MEKYQFPGFDKEKLDMIKEKTETMAQNERRYLAIREVLLNPGIDEGFFHTPNPGTAEGIDAAVDRLVAFLSHKRSKQ